MLFNNLPPSQALLLNKAVLKLIRLMAAQRYE